ncbi:MAG: SUMF1/EgtB/PvdO family nonheme iron enzyme [Marinicella sp.]
MKNILLSFALLFCSLAYAENRVALVVGNSNYSKMSRLENPVNDATDMTTKLRSMQFKVVSGLNLDKRAFTHKINEFERLIHEGNPEETVAVIFYAGHGLEVSGINYVIPVDADMRYQEDAEFEGIALKKIISRIERNNTKLNLVVLDACRNNPLRKKTRSASDGWAAMNNLAAGTFIAFGTSPGDVARDSDGHGRNGLFTKHILRYIDQPGLDLNRIFNEVRTGVYNDSAKQQLTWSNDATMGVYYFTPPVYDGVTQSPNITSNPAGSSSPTLPAKIPNMDNIKRFKAINIDDSNASPHSKAKNLFEIYRNDKGQYRQKVECDLEKLGIDPSEGIPSWACEEDDWDLKLITDINNDNRDDLIFISKNYSGGNTSVKHLRLIINKGEHNELFSLLLNAETVEKTNNNELKIKSCYGRNQDYLCKYEYYKFKQNKGLVRVLKPGDTFKDCIDCPEMVVIPAGSFRMGSNKKTDEQPIHTVNIKQFAMSTTEVTFAQWDACYNAGGCSRKPNDHGWGRGNRPVIMVSWNDAKEYSKWLSNKTGKSYRLPSESEWEYAALAGSSSKYSWGDSISCSQAKYGWRGDHCPGKGTSPVKSYAKNAFGLYDMHGNVWEWVEDRWHDNYLGAPADGSARTSSSDSKRVLRGGSWDFNPSYLRSATRSRLDPTSRGYDYGFRLSQNTE